VCDVPVRVVLGVCRVCDVPVRVVLVLCVCCFVCCVALLLEVPLRWAVAFTEARKKRRAGVGKQGATAAARHKKRSSSCSDGTAAPACIACKCV